MGSQEPWHSSTPENPGPPPPPPSHNRQSFPTQQGRHPVLPPPSALGSGNRQGYYPQLPSLSGLGANGPPQHQGYNLPSMAASSSPQMGHGAQSPPPSQAPLPPLSSSVVQQQPPMQVSPPAPVGGQPGPPPSQQLQQASMGPQHLPPGPMGMNPSQTSPQHAAASLPPQHQGPNGPGGPNLPLPPPSAQAAQQMAAYRPLNVKDALSYLDQVKIQFQNQPDVYNRFLDIMKDFKSQSIDTPGVIDRVSTLFNGHPNLIQGFNTFLPPGYRIECSLDPSDPNPIRVTTPMGTTTSGGSQVVDPGRGWGQEPQYAPYPMDPNVQQAGSMSSLQAAVNGSRPAPASEPKRPGGPVEFNHAISYVNKIKNRFASQPDIYKTFLEILQTYQREQKPIADVYAQVTMLFKDAPDLLDDFKQFLPEAAHQRSAGSPDGGVYGGPARLPPVGNFAPPSVTKEKKKRQAPSAVGGAMVQQGMPVPPMGHPQAMQAMEGAPMSGVRSSSNKKVKLTPKQEAMPLSPTLVPMVPEPLPPPSRSSVSPEELAFFDRVKKFIGNKPTYNEFLKVLNLFSQDIIDKNVLVDKVEGFIGSNKDLMDWFKRCVGYDGGTLTIENIPYKKHQLELSLCKSYGPSYRLLPKSETHQVCSGRDEMCWEVLNDEWVSHPTWASEDSGFVAHRKNQFEEVLHRIEEERHEYDYNVEGNLRTIQTLEPIANRIANMTAEEKANFKLPPGLGQSTKSIYMRIIKKIYDKERGQEVIDAMHDNPAVAIPIVLKRLKQKDEEWKRAQREWNKVWRETEARVFYKSLDHCGLTFKQADKKTLTAKFLITEIDTVKKEQLNKRLDPLSPLPKFQLQYTFTDTDVVMDVVRLLNCHLEHSSSFSSHDREKMDGFIKSFLPLFFGFTSTRLADEAAAAEDGDGDGDKDEASAQEDEEERSTPARKLRSVKDSDLLRDVLKKTKQTRKRERDDDSREATPEASEQSSRRETSEAPQDESEGPSDADKAGEVWIQHVKTKGADANGTHEASATPEQKRDAYNMFGNTTIYTFFRLFQILYHRLFEIKQLEPVVSADLASRNPVEFAKDLGIISTKIQDMGMDFSPVNCYGQVLDMCEKLIENDIEHQWFEESLRQAYRNRAFKTYTVDKLVQAIAKQTHTIISDAKCTEVVLLYDHDRHSPKTTPRQQIIYRLQVEAILGADESIYRLEWNDRTSTASIQLISHEDLTLNDAKTMEDKWKYYLTSYVMSAPTEGVPVDKVRMPFLRRNLPSDEPDENDKVDPRINSVTYSRSRLRVRICVNTYKMFFEQGTEDVFIRSR
ncbi:uncharacterized protein V1510DRAFT_409124 [Dipodascopsis tothii]|uniref:uncharacterized protein n=1 Tax=Dipodascopsis tothii TaxID=44089 RepID=UPI0034CEEC1C